MNNHQRKLIRLKNYDYSQAGLYFITICTRNRKFLFGEIVETNMIINECGEIVKNTWFDLVNHINNITLHEQEFVVMPNHIHGIIRNINTFVSTGNWAGLEPAPTPISEIIRQFKTFSAKRINKSYDTLGNNVWQRNYYEHIIRNEKSYIQIAEYIRSNPANWSKDKYFS